MPWLKAKAGRYLIRDGTEPSDPLVEVGPDKVEWFDKVDPEQYANASDVEIVHDPAPSDADKKRIAAVRKPKAAPPPPPPAEPAGEPKRDAQTVDTSFRDAGGDDASSTSAPVPQHEDKPRSGLFGRKK